MVGMIPATLQQLCNLQLVDMAVNHINGNIMEFMRRLPRCVLGSVQVLHLSDTSVSGQLLKLIGEMSALIYLDLSDNKLVGEIPQDNKLDVSMSEQHFANLVSLEWINLSGNSMKMVIGPSWRPPCRLVYVYFPDIQMGPQFPAWIRHQLDIKYLDISHAVIVDALPQWFWKSYSHAVYLNFSINQISGRLPSSLKFMTAALAIYLGSNNLTDFVPLLPEQLLVVDLSRTSLSGTIPQEFGAPGLVKLDVSSNRINGAVPTSLCQFPILLHLDLSNNNMNGHFLGAETCRQLAMRFLDLAHNMFSGTVPEWIGRKLPSSTHLRFFVYPTLV